MKIAIVGSGIAGLTCGLPAAAPARHHRFEAGTGSAAIPTTVPVAWMAALRHRHRLHRVQRLDLPNFIPPAGAARRPQTDGDELSVHDPATGVEYNGQPQQPVRPAQQPAVADGLGMLRDILRFNREALSDLAEQHRRRHHARPVPQPERLRPALHRPLHRADGRGDLVHVAGRHAAVPLQFFVRFFKNHGLLSVSDRPQWRVIGGSRSYVAPLSASYAEHIRLNCPVQRVSVTPRASPLHSAAGVERFDKVVFACHSDQALLALLATRAPPNATSSAHCATPTTTWCCTPTRACCPAAAGLGQLELPPRRSRATSRRR